MYMYMYEYIYTETKDSAARIISGTSEPSMTILGELGECDWVISTDLVG